MTRKKKLHLNWILIITGIIAAAAVILWVGFLSSSPPSIKQVTEINLPHLYTEKNNSFLIKYPVDWMLTEPRPATVMFRGKKDTTDADTTIVISKITYSKRSGIYQDPQAYVNFIKEFFQKVQVKPTVIDQGPIDITQVDGKLIKGRYMILKYTFQNKQYTQYEIVLDKGDNQNFYVLAYNAPTVFFQSGLPIFKTMLRTFKAE